MRIEALPLDKASPHSDNPYSDTNPHRGHRMTIEQWTLFLAIWIAASLPLGPNALNCIALSANAGLRRSVWSVAGILIASLCHMTATVLGFATILAANAMLFHALKICGGAYLVWMGIAMWRKGDCFDLAQVAAFPTRWKITRSAFLISMSNPKAVFAYVAVFSQFISPSVPLAEQMLVLVPTSFAVTILVYGGYCAAGVGFARLLGTVRRRLVFNRTVGLFYIAMGAGLSLADTQSIQGRQG